MDSDSPLGSQPDLTGAEGVVVAEAVGEGTPLAAPPTWGYRDLAYFALFSVCALCLVSVVIVAGFMSLNLWLGWNLTVDDPLVKAPLSILIQILLSAVVLAYIYMVITGKYELLFGPSIGWVAPRRPASLYLGSGVLLAFTVAAVSTLLPKAEGPVPLEELLGDEVSIILVALFGVIIAPLVEELIFRGFIYPVFERKHGATIAILLTSVPFAVLHGPQYAWRWQILILLLGVAIVFGTVRARTGSVVTTTLIHVAYNATLFGALLATMGHLKDA
jgi:membrane protease YdiL (CAAX protease family)